MLSGTPSDFPYFSADSVHFRKGVNDHEREARQCDVCFSARMSAMLEARTDSDMGPPLHVLVVDDELNIRKRLLICLETECHKVTAVSNLQAVQVKNVGIVVGHKNERSVNCQ